MGRTKIEWTERSLNIVTGCRKGCKYCYARRMAYRLRGRYGYDKDDPFKPTFHKDKLRGPYKVKKPSMWFVSTMGELFGRWVPEPWVLETLNVVLNNPHHTFQLLTKDPETMKTFNYILSELPNAWLGVSVEDQGGTGRIDVLKSFNGSNVKFVSFEPLLGPVDYDLRGIDWVIVGAQTNPDVRPDRMWVGDIVKNAKDRGVPVFLKNNLRPLFNRLIQEFPEEAKTS